LVVENSNIPTNATVCLVEPDGIEPTTSSMPLKQSIVFRSYHIILGIPQNHSL
jgi:hypothetical protein